jgi:hypothetical protein
MIRLHFNEVDLEAGFDFVRVYDGATRGRLLGTVSGHTVPNQLFTATTGQMLIVFVTDGSVHGDGFTAQYTSAFS